MSRRLIIPLASLAILATGTFLAIKFAQGYRPDLTSGKNIKGTGLLVANSFPSGAQVFLNNNLTTATDDTLNLPPGEYQIEIKKDGFNPWKKTLKLEAELVTQTNATLFPSVPTLRPLTFTGALNPLSSPNGQKLAYLVTTASTPTQNGLWVVDLNPTTPFIRSQQPRQVSRIFWSSDLPRLTWSPDSSQILAHLNTNNYLLDATKFNDLAQLKDVTAQLPLIFSQWEEQLARQQRQQFSTLPSPLANILLTAATNFYFSPDETKLLYTAINPVTIPDNLLPALPASNTQPQQRQLAPGATYVYDLKEDRNFLVLPPPPAELGDSTQPQLTKTLLVDSLTSESTTASAATKLQAKNLPQTLSAFTAQYTSLGVLPIQWFPNSTHLIFNQPDKVSILEYDGLNLTTIYSGSFDPSFVYPSPSGSQLLILTNLNQDSNLPPNLYSIDLK